ncbi:MAG: hypothetical protein SGCHY_000171 [Lobulomycetales sp.]
MDKTTVFCPSGRDLAVDDFAQHSGRIPEITWTTEGVKLLGGMLGTDNFKADEAQNKVAKVTHLMEEILQLKDPHRQLTLLRFCVSGFKIGILLRVTDAAGYTGPLIDLDKALDDAISITIGSTVSKKQRELIGMPIKLGGLGIPSACSIAGASYTASRKQSSKLQEQILNLPNDKHDAAMQQLLTTSGIQQEISWASFPEQRSNLQHKLLNTLSKHRATTIANEISPREKVLLEARQAQESVPWISLLCSESVDSVNTFLHISFANDGQRA